MDTLEIRNFIEPFNTKKIFKGVFACDDLPADIQLPAIYIINLSPKAEVGSHWVALYINIYGYGFYFDSFGLQPRNKYIQFFIRAHTKTINYNKKQLQHITSIKCGRFCCVFTIAIISKNSIRNFMDKFSFNLLVNEIVIDDMFKNLKQCRSVTHFATMYMQLLKLQGGRYGTELKRKY